TPPAAAGGLSVPRYHAPSLQSRTGYLSAHCAGDWWAALDATGAARACRLPVTQRAGICRGGGGAGPTAPAHDPAAYSAQCAEPGDRRGVPGSRLGDPGRVVPVFPGPGLPTRHAHVGPSAV